MEDISTGKDTGEAGLHTLIDQRTAGHRRHLRPQLLGQFILRKKSYRQEQRITGNVFFCAGDGFHPLIHFRQGHAFHPLFSMDLHHCGGQLQGDAEIVQALDNVPFQAAGVGHDLCYRMDLCPFQCHPARHDKADITGA